MQRNTIQRKQVLDVLLSLEGEHPSAERVYTRVHELYPTVSKATVYRILKDEAAEGRILGVDMPRDVGRYDSRVDRHYHIRCRVCGRVADVEMGKGTPDGLFADVGGFKIEDVYLSLSGICPECASAADAEKADAEKRAEDAPHGRTQA